MLGFPVFLKVQVAPVASLCISLLSLVDPLAQATLLGNLTTGFGCCYGQPVLYNARVNFIHSIEQGNGSVVLTIIRVSLVFIYKRHFRVR